MIKISYKKFILLSVIVLNSVPSFTFAQIMVPAIDSNGLPMGSVPMGLPIDQTPHTGTTNNLNPPVNPIIQQDQLNNPANGVTYPITPPPVINPIDQTPVSLTNKENTSVNITKKWRNKKSMPATGNNGSVIFTYGATQPSIVCAPLTICLLKLEPEEKLTKDGIQLGDATRWLITPTKSGNQIILAIKPTDSGLRTTLAIMTSKRVYTIKLVSVSAQNKSMAITEFSYPEEIQKKWQEYYDEQQQIKQNNTMPENGSDVSQLDFNFKVKGKTSWKPTRVYTDGVHTFIQFPKTMASGDAPSLLALGNNKGLFSSPTEELVNYRKQGNTFVVDKVINKAELILGVGGSKEKVVIEHEH